MLSAHDFDTVSENTNFPVSDDRLFSVAAIYLVYNKTGSFRVFDRMFDNQRLSANRSCGRVLALVLGLAVIGSVLFAGITLAAQQTEADQDGTANVRVVHASPDAPAVDVYVNDEPVLEDVSFGTVSDYLELEAGTYDVTITAADDPEAVVYEAELPVEEGTYTIAAAGELSENATEPFQPVLLLDESEEPADGTALVRLAHLSPDASTVDVTVADSGDVLFDNASFANATGYQEVPAGSYTLEIRAATPDEDGEVVETVDVSLADGETYTAFAVGYLDPETAPGDESFAVILAEDSIAANNSSNSN